MQRSVAAFALAAILGGCVSEPQVQAPPRLDGSSEEKFAESRHVVELSLHGSDQEAFRNAMDVFFSTVKETEVTVADPDVTSEARRTALNGKDGSEVIQMALEKLTVDRAHRRARLEVAARELGRARTESVARIADFAKRFPSAVLSEAEQEAYEDKILAAAEAGNPFLAKQLDQERLAAQKARRKKVTDRVNPDDDMERAANVAWNQFEVDRQTIARLEAEYNTAVRVVNACDSSVYLSELVRRLPPVEPVTQLPTPPLYEVGPSVDPYAASRKIGGDAVPVEPPGLSPTR
ncbi:MAG TPA: DUF6694 family lipoprotein [Pirellulaceae bacterium]|jgi:hypothetical protein|nr:DUF6694 family lipoprotein [Pirellulaceae bacterium]